MPAHEKTISAARLSALVMGDKDSGQVGLYEQALGFRTATAAFKGVHLMNDLAQCVVGGRPEHRADLLCGVIREDQRSTKEDNRDETLRSSARFGEAYSRAYPADLGTVQVSRLREAARLLLNFDKGMYRAGDNMASGLATHWTLLGAEGFRRFKVGRYLETILGEPGQQRLRALFQEDRDPVSQALRPLLFEDTLRDSHPARQAPQLSPFDRSLGQRLTTLLLQPLSKPMLLRSFLLASSLGLVLKILGSGKAAGRPVALALPSEVPGGGRRPLRQEAVQSLQRGLQSFDRHLARLLPTHPDAEQLWSSSPADGEAGVTVSGDSLEAAALQLIEAAHKVKKVYPPNVFALSLGKQVGCVRPKTDRAGWGKHLVLHEDLLEALILMFVPDGAPPLPWSQLWSQIGAELGLYVGANEYTDMMALTEGGVVHVNLQELTQCSATLLAQAVRRGVARRLPDSGAEAGGALL
jgi:hypothetical protein